jgi:anti-anti-sigma regulatory factor
VLRITTVEASHRWRTLKVEGRLTGEFAGELSRVATAALGESGVKLDLADVTFADHNGVRVLRALRKAGVQLVAPSEFLLALMNGERT